MLLRKLVPAEALTKSKLAFIHKKTCSFEQVFYFKTIYLFSISTKLLNG